MIFAISKFIANLFGLDISKVQRYVFWAVVLLGLLAVLILVIGIKSCFSRPPKVMTEAEKQEVKEQIAKGETTKLKEKLVELEVKEEVIEGNVANANAAKWAAIQNSKEKWANANISDLQAEFDRRMNE